MNPDTRVALVGEDTARKRIERAMLDGRAKLHRDRIIAMANGDMGGDFLKGNNSLLGTHGTYELDAILAELFPEADKPLKVVDVRQLLDDAEQCAVFWDRDGYDGNAGEVRDNAARIEEELNRG